MEGVLISLLIFAEATVKVYTQILNISNCTPLNISPETTIQVYIQTLMVQYYFIISTYQCSVDIRGLPFHSHGLGGGGGGVAGGDVCVLDRFGWQVKCNSLKWIGRRCIEECHSKPIQLLLPISTQGSNRRGKSGGLAWKQGGMWENVNEFPKN